MRRSDTCYTCRFWVGFGVHERGPEGTCQRFPPTVTPRHPKGQFPITKLTDWCGEWIRAGVGPTAEPVPPDVNSKEKQ